ESSRGGVKTMDLMGALLNNKDDKKGQGDIHANVAHALDNPAISTELCATVLYMNAILHLYLHVVCSGNVNALDLSPLNAEVKSHVNKILKDPDILFGKTASYATGSLNGKEWEDPEAVRAVHEPAATLPCLKNITLAFFRGSLATWEHFSSEFAPGGLMDEATPEEKWKAWRSAMNFIY
ncbi:hypothetical protein GYMLUDRAFT_170531, partial [Collybiopsis luxurians FD-317 M1]